MKELLYTGVFFCAAVWAGMKLVAHQLNAEPSKPASATVAAAKPPRPLTAVLYMSCDQLVAAAMTTADGQLLAFDGGTGVPIQDVLALANTAVKKARVDAPCERQVGT